MPKTLLESSPVEVAIRPQAIVPVDKTPVVAKPLPAAPMSGVPTDLLTNHGGKVLGNVQVIPIYWGAAWASVSDIHQAVADVLNSPYLSEMMQYGFRWLTLDPPLIVHKPYPPSPTFSGDDAKNMVWALIDDETFPEPDDDSGDGRIVYMVFAPQGSNYKDLEHPSAGGAHGDAEDKDFLDVDHAWVGWVDFDSSLDGITELFTHELVEILSDPEPTSGWQVTSPEGLDEIADACLKETGVVNGHRVSAYYSKRLEACVVPSFPLLRSLDLEIKQSNEGPVEEIALGEVNVHAGRCFTGTYEWQLFAADVKAIVRANIDGYTNPDVTWTVNSHPISRFPISVTSSSDAPVLDPLHLVAQLPPWQSTIMASATGDTLTLAMAMGQFPVDFQVTCSVEERDLPPGYGTERSSAIDVFISSAFRRMDQRFENDLEKCVALERDLARSQIKEYPRYPKIDLGDPAPPWVGRELSHELSKNLEESYILAAIVDDRDPKLAGHLRAMAGAAYGVAYVKKAIQEHA